MQKHMLNRKWVGFFASWIFILSIFPTNAFAMPSASIPMDRDAAARDIQMSRILSVFEHPTAQLHLRRMGMDSADLRVRLEGLQDAELAQLAQRTESIKAGAGAAGIAIVVLVILLVILAWLYATNRAIEIKER